MTYQDQFVQENRKSIFSKVFGWMAFALFITGIIAYAGAFISPINIFFMTHFKTIFYTSLISQLALVITLSFFIMRLSFPIAIGLFIIYSVLMGVTFSSLFYIYTFTSLINTFFITAGMFGTMAVYGAYTKSDLSQLGSILTMALIGLIIALIVNIFMQSSLFDLILSGFGVIIFSGLTAVNIQEIKHLEEQLGLTSESENKIGLLGALMLYLNFINLFLSLLRFTGKRRDI